MGAGDTGQRKKGGILRVCFWRNFGMVGYCCGDRLSGITVSSESRGRNMTASDFGKAAPDASRFQNQWQPRGAGELCSIIEEQHLFERFERHVSHIDSAA